MKGNQWVFIVPDHKAGYLFGGNVALGSRGTLDSHEVYRPNSPTNRSFESVTPPTPERSCGTCRFGCKQWGNFFMVKNPTCANTAFMPTKKKLSGNFRKKITSLNKNIKMVGYHLDDGEPHHFYPLKNPIGSMGPVYLG